MRRHVIILKQKTREEELWMVSANFESRLVFPIVKTTLRPDLVVSSMEKKRAILLELTVLWEQNTSADEPREKIKYEELVRTCTKKS